MKKVMKANINYNQNPQIRKRYEIRNREDEYQQWNQYRRVWYHDPVLFPLSITIGKDVFEVLHPEIKSEFVEVEQNIENWKYTDRMTGRIYNLYSLQNNTN